MRTRTRPPSTRRPGLRMPGWPARRTLQFARCLGSGLARPGDRFVPRLYRTLVRWGTMSVMTMNAKRRRAHDKLAALPGVRAVRRPIRPDGDESFDLFYVRTGRKSPHPLV